MSIFWGIWLRGGKRKVIKRRDRRGRGKRRNKLTSIRNINIKIILTTLITPPIPHLYIGTHHTHVNLIKFVHYQFRESHKLTNWWYYYRMGRCCCIRTAEFSIVSISNSKWWESFLLTEEVITWKRKIITWKIKTIIKMMRWA